MVSEILNSYSTQDLMDIFRYGWSGNDDFKEVEDKIDSYDEGYLFATRVIQHIPSGKFLAWDYHTNSWADYASDFREEDVYEVKPVEKMITVYERI